MGDKKPGRGPKKSAKKGSTETAKPTYAQDKEP